MKEVLIVLLLVVAIFLCIVPPSIHRSLLEKVGITVAIPHVLTLMIGLILFVFATVLSQKELIQSAVENFENVKQVIGALYYQGSKMYDRASKISAKAINKLPTMDKLVDKVEHFVDTHDFN